MVESVANIVVPLAINATFFVPLPVTATARVIATVFDIGPLVEIPINLATDTDDPVIDTLKGLVTAVQPASQLSASASLLKAP